MSERKHTPGPWFFHKNSAQWFEIQTEPGEFKPSHAAVWQRGSEGEANARLIAAAPQMLEALEACQHFITNAINYGAINPHDKRKAEHVETLAVAAIAAATGEKR